MLCTLVKRQAEYEYREDARAAMVAVTIANIFRDKNSRALSVEDLVGPGPEQRMDSPKKQTWQEQLAIVEALNAAFGGKDLRKKADG